MDRRSLLKMFGAGCVIAPVVSGQVVHEAESVIIKPPEVELASHVPTKVFGRYRVEIRNVETYALAMHWTAEVIKVHRWYHPSEPSVNSWSWITYANSPAVNKAELTLRLIGITEQSALICDNDERQFQSAYEQSRRTYQDATE